MKTNLFTILLISCFSAAYSATIYVDADATGGTYNGQTWGTAYQDLQSALTAASLEVGDEIWVAEGTYKPDASDRNISFEIPSGVKVYGGFAGNEDPLIFDLADRDFVTNETILSGNIGDGEIDTDNSYHVVKFTNAASTTILDGFTITKGYADGGTTDTPNACGGGIYNDGSGSGNSSNPQITNCIITYNYAYYQGGGVHNEANVGETTGTAGESSPTFTNCDITYNSTTLDGAGVNNEGEDGSVSSPSFTDCTISNNTAEDDGGGVCNDGSIGTASPVFINCIINDNNASGYGGGLYNDGDEGISSPAFTNCTFNGNYSAEGGGAIFNSGWGGTTSPNVTNCTFNGNSTDGDGGAIYNYGRIYNGSGEASPIIDGSVFTSNTAKYSDLGGGAIYNIAWGAGSIVSPTIKNTSFKGNSSTYCGGAIAQYGYDGYLNQKITNCLFIDNTADYGGAIYDLDDGSDNIDSEITNCTFNNNNSYAYGAENSGVNATITNCIFWEDTDGEIQDYGGNYTITYSDVEGGYTGTGNINSDPLFADAANDDYRLTSFSPCTDVGSDGENNETTDIRGTGFGRKLDKTTGLAGTIDMGAYEYQPCTDDYAFSGGSGTSEDPYQIANTQDLVDLSSATCHWDKHFIQTAAIDFGTVTPANHAPIGNSTTPFTGTYDGDNKNIRALSVSQTSNYAGMFGYVDGGEIKDLTLSLLQVSGGDDYVGGLIGYATGATITNVEILGTTGTGITGKYELGGMIGEASDCVITNADANVTVTSSGSTNAGSNIGGLIGLASTTGSGSISNCTSDGTVTSDGGEDVGGLIGESQVNVSNCSSNADVTAVDFVGGLIGFADGGTIQDSYYEGSSVIGNDYVGGLIGDAGGCAISGCYAGGDIDVIGDTDDYIGGLIGRADNCTITGSSFSFGTVTGDDWTGGLIGYAFNNCDISTSYCYPFVTVTGYHNTGGFIGENDWGTVYKCYSAADVNAQGDNVGGFIGLNDDSDGTPEVTECYSTGNVDGTDADDSDDTGGFIGENWGLVENCYSTGDVSNSGGSSGWFAAFIGNNKDEGTVRYCYTTGDYTTATGGDKGFIHPSSENAVGTGNFYESSQTSGAGATKKTTSQMSTATNYLNASWDFTKTGAEWAMNQDENSGYPFLRFQADDLFDPLTPGYIWLGAAKSSSWDAAGNWSEGELPGTTSNVIIPDVANDVEIASGVGADCNKLTVETGASLTIKSGGSLITLGAITNEGTITTERQIDDSEWHLISIPCPGITANTFLWDYLQTWDETTHSWTDIVDPETILDTKIGYSLWGTPDKATYSFTGTPLTGNQSQAVTFTEYSNDPNANEGANLLGNPYPSSIDWSGLDGDDWGAVYFWDQTIDNGGGSFGNYASWNNGVGVNGGTQYIPPTQGFFIVVEAGDHGSNFSLSNTNRTHSGATGFYKSADALSNGLKLYARYGELEDELAIVFNEDATQGYEKKYDAYKLLSSSEGISQLYTITEQKKLSIDVRHEVETLQLGFLNSKTGVYTIGIKEIADITEVYLEDTKTGKFHNLMNDKYEFSWNPEVDNEDRFILHFKAVGIEETQTIESNILIYAADKQIFVKGADKGDIVVLDLMGRTILHDKLSGDGSIHLPGNLQTGIYMVTVQNGNQIITEKVFIK